MRDAEHRLLGAADPDGVVIDRDEGAGAEFVLQSRQVDREDLGLKPGSAITQSQENYPDALRR